MPFPIASVALNQLDMIIKKMKDLFDERLMKRYEELLRMLVENLKKVDIVLTDEEDTVYEINDVLDEWSTALVKFEIEQTEKKAEDAAMLKKVRMVHSMPCLIPFAVGQNIFVKTKLLNSKLEKLLRMRIGNHSGLNSTSRTQVDQKIKSVFDSPEVIGRKKDKTNVIKYLLEESKDARFVYIIGEGGVGKTTLALLIKADEEVKTHFQSILWVSFSRPFDEVEIAKAIIKEVEGVSPIVSELDLLLEPLGSFVNKTKFLLVLDGMSADGYNEGGQLEMCLKSSGLGSRVLVTTRDEKLANGSIFNHKLANLSPTDSRKLFSSVALYGRNQKECDELEAMVSKLAQSCECLPLALKILGCFMCQKNKNDWNGDLSSRVTTPRGNETVLYDRILSLCSEELPNAVRHCFSYCAIFPKDERIEKEDLIKLWKAQGFLSDTESFLGELGCQLDTKMENVGIMIFNHLAKRSFFQQFTIDEYDGEITSCKMHHLVHDFAQNLAGKDFFAKEVTHVELFNEGDAREEATSRERVLLPCARGGVSSKPKPNRKVQTLTIRNIRILRDSNSYLSSKFQKFTSIRVLNLTDNLVTEIPGEVGELMHLRYLNLSKNKHLKTLPSSLCSLYHLQTLNINWCFDLYELPKEMGRLIKLRHLENDGTFKLKFLPKGIAKLRDIQTLTRFPVSKGSEDEACKLEDLTELNKLGGYVNISGLGNLIEAEKANNAKLKEKVHIVKLKLDFYSERKRSSAKKDEKVLDALEPGTSLTQMVVIGYRGKSVSPSWMDSIKGLRSLELKKLTGIKSLPPLGSLPHLKFLHIEGMKNVKKLNVEFLGDLNSSTNSYGFPKLHTLVFLGMKQWEHWEDCNGVIDTRGKEVSIMPELRFLKLLYCPKLEQVPDFIKCEPNVRGCSDKIVSEFHQRTRRSKGVGVYSHYEQSIKNLWDQLREDLLNYLNISKGIYYIAMGLIKQFLRKLATNLQVQVDNVDMPPLEPAGN